jgi:hypothetical protein
MADESITELVPTVTIDAVLVPLDRKQCMALRVQMTRQQLFGLFAGVPVGPTRCTNAPMFIVGEVVANESGHLHQMTVCSDCAGELRKQRPGRLSYSPL